MQPLAALAARGRTPVSWIKPAQPARCPITSLLCQSRTNSAAAGAAPFADEPHGPARPRPPARAVRRAPATAAQPHVEWRCQKKGNQAWFRAAHKSSWRSRHRRRAGAAPRRSCGQFVRLNQSKLVIGHRAGCAGLPRRETCDRVRRGLREVGWVRSAATARGSKSGGAQRKGLPADKRPRSHTHHTHASRSGGLVTKGTQRRGPDRPPIPWVSPVMKLGTSRPKKGSARPSSCSTRTGRAASCRRRSLLL